MACPKYRRHTAGRDLVYTKEISNASVQTIIISSKKEAVPCAEIPQILRGKDASLKVPISSA